MDDPFHLRRHEITDPAVLTAFQEVDRVLFIDASLGKFAMLDDPLPIGEGQTISQPSLVAHMTQLLHILPYHHILEIGTGSGFQAAILAKIARQVTTIEVIPSLYEQSKKRLADLGYHNVSVFLGDGHSGYPLHAPFDGIIVTAASPSVPDALTEQLKTGGRLIIPVGSQNQAQRLTIITRDEGGNLTQQNDIFVRFVPFIKSKKF